MTRTVAGPREGRRSAGGPSPARDVGRLEAILLLVLALDCLGVLAIWTVALAGGAFGEGLFTYQLEGTVPVFHLAAELAMAVVALVGLWARWTARPWGRGVLLFALGMLGYSALNSLGWAVHNDLATAVPMVVTLLLAAVLVPVLLRSGRHSPRAGSPA